MKGTRDLIIIDDDVGLKLVNGLSEQNRFAILGLNGEAYAFGYVSRTMAEYGLTRAPEQRVSMRYFCWL